MTFCIIPVLSVEDTFIMIPGNFRETGWGWRWFRMELGEGRQESGLLRTFIWFIERGVRVVGREVGALP